MSITILRTTIIVKLKGSSKSSPFSREELSEFLKAKGWKVESWEKHDALPVTLNSGGRPRTIDPETIKELALSGLSPYRISETLGVSYRSVKRYIKKLGLEKKAA